MKISSFLKISWFGVRICNFESKFSFFFHLQLHFFHFPLFLMVFHCFSLFFMAFLDFRCHGQGKWKKNDKKMKISSSFCRFPGSEWESATLSPNVHFFFICNFSFFSFSFVFDGFPLFFMVFLDFRCHGQGKWKKNEKKMIKTWKFPRFWRFPGSEWESATLSPNFHFFFICNFIFFHFPLFLMVFHCFSWFSWISGATGKENEKKWSLKWKNMKFEMKKKDVWNKKHEVWRNKKRKKNEKKWKINEK